MNWCILIPLLVGLISAILGYLLGKLLGGENSNDNNSSIDVYKTRISKLESDLDACKASKTKNSGNSGNAGASGIASSFAAPVAASASASLLAFNAEAAKAVFGKKIKKDDLTIVEGIGPKIQELFHNHDVKTWKALSECSQDKCQKVLDSGGERFKIHKPGTWPEQAKMAYEGEWQKLKDWQDALDGGK
ncbi:hypothetical protein [Lacinutrix salivirga]